MQFGVSGTVQRRLAAGLLATALAAGVANGAGRARAQSSVDCGGPYTGATGQPVVMTATIGLHGVVTFFWTYGDGASGDKNPTSHVYTQPGTYTVSMRVTSSTLDSETCDTSVTVGGGSMATPAPTQTGGLASLLGSGGSGAAGAGSVSVATGWNLVAGPTGSRFPQAGGSLYTLQASDAAYEVLAPTAGMQGGLGYWAFFTGPATVQFAGAGTSSASISAPAGQWVMVGDPSATASVRVAGADSVLRYDPSSGSYLATTVLAPGQGAWAISMAGGTISIAPQ